MDQSHGFILAVGPTDDSIDSALTDLSHFCALTLNEYLDGMPKNDRIATERDLCLELLSKWNSSEKVDFMKQFLTRMNENQWDPIQTYLIELRRKDVISMLSKCEKEHIAQKILRNLDGDSLKAAKLVCKEWLRIVSNGMP